MTESEIASFLVKNVQPWNSTYYGTYYRASAYLLDQTFLPCVMFGNPSKLVDLAIRRFKETVNTPDHRAVVASFVARKAGVPIYNVSRVELSAYAWPEVILNQIHGETIMGWTAFTATMKDGNTFNFGTTFTFEFFDLPQGYSYNDIAEIHSGMVVDESGVERHFSLLQEPVNYYREKPFFYCYSECLPSL